MNFISVIYVLYNIVPLCLRGKRRIFGGCSIFKIEFIHHGADLPPSQPSPKGEGAEYKDIN
jgi:hypothetical protein